MPESITPLLAERLDIPEEQAQSLLETMVQELRQRTKTDAVQLSGLGTFRQEEGTLVFQPGPVLRRRVNRQFEGLSAEPLTPAAEGDAEATPPSGRSAAGTTDTPDSTDPEEPPPFMQSPPAPDETEDTTETHASTSDSDDTETSSAPDRPPADRDQPEDRSPDSFTVISLVLLVLFLLGAGWFVLDRTNVWGPNSTASSQTSTQSPTASEEPPTASNAQDPSESNESPSDGAEDEATPSSSQDADSPTQNWTIIVGSRSSRSAAQEVADAYASRFDSVAVVAGTVDNTTWYRVAVGRYSSEADAEQALADQSDALPSDAWTHNLR